MKNLQWIDNHATIDQQSKNAYQFQTGLSTTMEKQFQPKWQNITKLRHKFVPSLDYEYRIPKDQQTFKPWFEPIDTDGRVNKATLTLDNLFDGRKENKKGAISYFQLSRFKLYQGYDIDEARRDDVSWRKKTPLDPLKTEFSLTPVSGLNLRANTWWDHYEDEITYFDTTMNLSVNRSGGRKDKYSVQYGYRQGSSRSMTYSLDLNLKYGYSVGGSQKRDLRYEKTISQDFWLEYWSQCWSVRVTAAKHSGDDSIMVMFSLLGLGDIGF